MGQLIISRDVPGGPVVKSTPEKKKKESACSAGNMGLIPGQGPKIPHTEE